MTDSNDDGLKFTYAFLALLLCSLFLIFLSSSTRLLHTVEQLIAYVTHPIYVVSNFPRTVVETGSYYFSSRRELLGEINQLKRELLVQRNLNADLQYLRDTFLDMQSTLAAYRDERSQYQLVEVIGINPSSERHQLIVNRGSDSGIEIGMAVIDSKGVFGQIIEVFSKTALVLTLHDSKHAIPVTVRRTGYRSIATGNGLQNHLTLENVSASADIQVGDELVTSGLGGRFPKGFNVGTVHSRSTNDTKTVLRVEVQPAANLFSSRFLLVGSVQDNP